MISAVCLAGRDATRIGTGQDTADAGWASGQDAAEPQKHANSRQWAERACAVWCRGRRRGRVTAMWMARVARRRSVTRRSTEWTDDSTGAVHSSTEQAGQGRAEDRDRVASASGRGMPDVAM